MYVYILHNVINGHIYGHPYQGDFNGEWTNFPIEGLTVIGPMKVEELNQITIDCLQDPELYLVLDGQVVRKPNADDILAERARQAANRPPTVEEQLLAVQEQAEFDRRKMLNLQKQLLTLQQSTLTTP